MRYFLFGLLLSLLSIFVTLVIWDIHMVYVVAGTISLFFIVVSMLLSGSFVSGDRMRANVAMESDEDRENRYKVTTRSLLMALPNLIVALLFYILL